MHEFTVTSWLVEALLDIAKKQGSRRVLEVHVKIGKLRALSVEQLMFAYSVLAKGTILEGSKLFVEETNGAVHCAECGHSGKFTPEDQLAYHYVIPLLLCPQCGKNLSVEGGDEFLVTKVRMQIPTEADNFAYGSGQSR